MTLGTKRSDHHATSNSDFFQKTYTTPKEKQREYSRQKKTEGVASNASNVCAAKANVSVSFYAEKEEPCM